MPKSIAEWVAIIFLLLCLYNVGKKSYKSHLDKKELKKYNKYREKFDKNLKDDPNT